MQIGLGHYLTLAAILFGIGLFGVITRRNAIGILMSLELMFNAANINFVAFNRFITPTDFTGQLFAIFIDRGCGRRGYRRTGDRAADLSQLARYLCGQHQPDEMVEPMTRT